MASTGTKCNVNCNTVRVYKQLPNGVCVDSIDVDSIDVDSIDVDSIDIETLRYLRHVEAKRAPGETSQI